MSNVSELRKRVKALMREYDATLSDKEDVCSDNAKTGSSINVPQIVCNFTTVCSNVCYGAMRGRPITWPNSLKKYIRVYRYLLSALHEEAADRIHREYERKHMTFLRWNGVGDLFPESATIVTQLVKRHPEDVLLVVTRKPNMIPLIPKKADNLYLMFSLDGCKESERRKAEVLRLKHPRLYFSFLRRFPDEDTMGARIVFNAQQSKKILPFDDPVTVCPVDADKIPVKGACVKCRKCFRPDVLDGSKHCGKR